MGSHNLGFQIQMVEQLCCFGKRPSGKNNSSKLILESSLSLESNYLLEHNDHFDYSRPAPYRLCAIQQMLLRHTLEIVCQIHQLSPRKWSLWCHAQKGHTF